MDENIENAVTQEGKTPVAGRSMVIGACLMYIAAYVYAEYKFQAADCGFDGVGDSRLIYVAFVLMFITITEIVHRDKSHSAESFIWFGCVAIITLSVALTRGNAFEWMMPRLFNGVFAVWWVLSRSDTLIAGESGAFLLFDALNGFVVFPFKNFFLRIKTVWKSLTGRKKHNVSGVLGGVLGTALTIGLLICAFSSLVQADSGFEHLTMRFVSWVKVKLSMDLGELPGKLFFSLPVGAYLFGLIGGSALESRENLSQKGEKIRQGVEKLRIVPLKVWIISIGAFCLLYGVFFCLQFGYLFGAFVRKLPEGFVVAEYARQGFFELCRVMGINFALLWLASRTAVTRERAGKVMCTILMVCSMVFAIIALSKLGLYISCFGFTPKRLQSTWLVLVLLCGSICAVYSMWTEKSSFKAWMIMGAVSLSLLCLY